MRLLRLNLFGNFSFGTVYFEIRCFNLYCFNELKLINLLDNELIEQVCCKRENVCLRLLKNADYPSLLIT